MPMSSPSPAVRRRPLCRLAGLRRFRRDDEGSFALEAAIWVPAAMALLLAATDISVTFFSYARMWDVARDTARRAATGQLATGEVEGYALGRLNDAWNCRVAVDDDREDVMVTIASTDLGPVFGLLDMFAPGALSASLTMRKETVALASADTPGGVPQDDGWKDDGWKGDDDHDEDDD